jgi:hypothetical protein
VHSRPVTIAIPITLLALIDRHADAAGRTRSEVICRELRRSPVFSRVITPEKT